MKTFLTFIMTNTNTRRWTSKEKDVSSTHDEIRKIDDEERGKDQDNIIEK